MRRLFIIILVPMAAAGCAQKEKLLGKAPQDPHSTVLAIRAGDAPTRLTLEGTLIEKCPQAGCWFRIDDGSGVIKVDTKGAGFVVTSVPLNAKVKVAGKLQQVDDDVQIEASGISY
jgi:uncharacterized protein YdeI (BOF family)